MGISITQVKEEKITNIKVRKLFYNIQDAESLIAVKLLKCIGKVVRREDSFYPKQLLTAWVNHKRKPGGVLTSNRKAIVQALTRLYPENTFLTDANDEPSRDCFGKRIPDTIYIDASRAEFVAGATSGMIADESLPRGTIVSTSTRAHI